MQEVRPVKALKLALFATANVISKALMTALHDIYIVGKTRFIGSGFIVWICPEEGPEIDVYFVLYKRYFCTLIE